MSETRLELRQRWHEIVQQQELSGRSVADFVQERGLPAHRFYAWRRRLHPVDSTRDFVEVQSADRSVSRAVEICLRGRRRLRVRQGFNPALLAEVVRALEGMP